MKVYYWKGKKNFGDLLAPLLIKKFTNIPSEWASPQESELVMVGSILEQLPSDFSGVIAGCGQLHQSSQLSFPNARILGVRGPLTAKALGLKWNEVIMGDPGLLSDELVGYKDKEYNLGIVAHWTDNKLTKDKRFTKYNPRIINVSDDPLYVISEIAKCRKIVSSSLHGIIVADAYGIPRRIELAPRMISHPHQEGGLFKWQDYSASIGMEFKIGLTQEADRNKITEVQHALFDLFETVKTIYH